MTRRMTAEVARSFAISYRAFNIAHDTQDDNGIIVWGQMYLDIVAQFPKLAMYSHGLAERIVLRARERKAARKAVA